jgi:hypothetical protein
VPQEAPLNFPFPKTKYGGVFRIGETAGVVSWRRFHGLAADRARIVHRDDGGGTCGVPNHVMVCAGALTRAPWARRVAFFLDQGQ